MALCSFAGGQLWGARYGTGRPRVLALHGWGRDHHDFDAVLGGLDAVALDLPGHGVAPEPPSSWSTRQYAQWAALVLPDMGPRPLVVVGHSFGGRVALQLATAVLQPQEAGAAPAGRSCLVLSGVPVGLPPGHSPGRPALAYRRGRALGRAGLLAPARLEQLRQKYGSDDYRRASPLMRGVLVQAVQETRTGTYGPLLRAWASSGHRLELVWGQQDTQAPLGPALAAVAGLPSVHVSVVPGAGHLLAPALAAQLKAAIVSCLGPEAA